MQTFFFFFKITLWGSHLFNCFISCWLNVFLFVCFFSYQGSRNLTCYCGKQGFNFFLSDFFYFLLWKAMLSSTILLGSYFWFFTNLCEFLSWMLHLLYTFAIFGKGHTAHARRRLKLLMRTVYMMYMMIAQLAKIVFKTEYSPPPPAIWRPWASTSSSGILPDLASSAFLIGQPEMT